MYILFKDEFPIDKVMIIDLISIIHVIFWSLHIGGGGLSKLVRQEVKDLLEKNVALCANPTSNVWLLLE